MSQLTQDTNLLKALYLRGLKVNLQREFVIRRREEILDLQTIIIDIIWLNNYIYHLGIKPNQGRPCYQTQQGRPKITQEGGDAIDLNNVQTQKNHTQKGRRPKNNKQNPKKAKRFKEGVYLGYGKKGHFIKDYKEKEIRVVNVKLVNIDKSIVYVRPQSGYRLGKNSLTERTKT